MLDIINSKDYAPYQCEPRPVIQITHQFRPEQLEELLKVAAKTLGPEEVSNILGNEPRGGGAFMVFVEGGGSPQMKHGTYHAAEAEAKRLAQKLGRDARVLKVMAEVAVQQRTETKVRRF